MSSRKEAVAKDTERFTARLAEIFASSKGKPLSRATLAAGLEGASKSKRAFKAALRELARQGKIIKLQQDHYAAAGGKFEVVGKFRMLPSGRAVVIPEETMPPPFSDAGEVRISDRGIDTALHGDKVRVRLDRQRRDGKPSGVVLSVLERRLKSIVGQYRGSGRTGRLFSRDDVFGRLIELPSALPPEKARQGDWIEARIVRYTPHPQPLLVEFQERLGSPDDAGIDITVLLRSMGCREEFPESVIREVEEFPDSLPPEEKDHRRDLRERLIFTIDGADAKDFDDAISIERLGSEDTGRRRWRLGVHIADVSYYVRAGSQLDADARDRATSIYPIDRVVPMLPERLSNDLCSLVPRQDRPALSCEMVIDARGRVEAYEIFESVIHSSYRLTYERVEPILSPSPAADGAGETPGKAEKKAQKPEVSDDPQAIAPVLLEANELAKCLTRMRMERGALDLDVPESKVLLNAQGRTVDIVRRERLEAHRLIEEFMLIANETVAEHMKNHRLPTLYRVHAEPDLERLEQLAPALSGMGLPVGRGEWTVQRFQTLLEATTKKENGSVIRRLMLRALKRAEYHPVNIGHFGLASKTYLHFTSPIRRYPDLLTHRALRTALRLKGDERDSALEAYREELPEMGNHTSYREREAMRVELDAGAIKGMELMERHRGEEFRGVISSIISAGAFVELSRWPVEGMMSVKNLPGYWDFDEDTITLVNGSSGERFRIGDPVTVRVESVEVWSGRMDLQFIERLSGSGKPKAPYAHPKRKPGNRTNRKAGGAMSGKSKKSRRKPSSTAPKPKTRSHKSGAGKKGKGKRRK